MKNPIPCPNIIVLVFLLTEKNESTRETVNAIYLFNESISDALAHLIENHVEGDLGILSDDVFSDCDVT